MEHTSKYYEDKFAEYNTRAESTAQALYRAALDGKITYAEAWYSLPAPAPHVNMEMMGYAGPVYDVTYRYLPKQDVTNLKYQVEREFTEAIKERETAYNQIRQNADKRDGEIADAVKNTRGIYDGSVLYPMDLKKRIEEMKNQLVLLESAYEKAMTFMEEAKQAKEKAEQEQADYLASKNMREMEAKASAEARINILAGFRDRGIEVQKRETDEFNALWNNIQEAKKSESDMAKRVAAQQQAEALRQAQQREFEKRIEEEAAKRIKDSEFEELVRKKMADMSRRNSVTIKL